ncbi:MAG: hypothetical protein F4227_04695 [Gammaproteobacteria bacterium]|nr:hypothetical protein [Gammaproteobacteria bacterium]MYF02268.1 hypothetical protein [Gammaproteobacteria bacterium]MYI78179.1 hypothetical protein [Gammaproteobacteria bacterium]
MKSTLNWKITSIPLLVSAFALGVLCTLLIGAVTANSPLSFDMDRDEQPLKIALDEAFEKFHSETGSEEITISKSELWDFVELGYWLGVYSHTVNMAQIVSYYDFQLLDSRERGSSLVGHMNNFIEDQCERQTNRFAIIMRRKFENNKPEFKATFGELQTLLALRADVENSSVVCPFEDAGLELYEIEEIEDETP